jgi:hypothetical protein
MVGVWEGETKAGIYLYLVFNCNCSLCWWFQQHAPDFYLILGWTGARSHVAPSRVRNQLVTDWTNLTSKGSFSRQEDSRKISLKT